MSCPERKDSSAAQASAKRGDLLSDDNLMLAVRTLVGLAVELKQVAVPIENGAAEVDADIYQELADLEGTRKVLEDIVSKLIEHQETRAKTVEYCRKLHIAREVTSTLPAATDLPEDAKTRVLDIARRNGIELSEDTAAKVCEAARRQGGSGDSRGVRIVRVLGFDSPEATTIDHHLSLLKPGAKPLAAGKFKYPAQLDAAFHEGVAGTDGLKYFLNAIGSDVPRAAERALEAWSEALDECVARAVDRLG